MTELTTIKVTNEAKEDLKDISIIRKRSRDKNRTMIDVFSELVREGKNKELKKLKSKGSD